jgi:ribose 5-phosphate isomerase B
MKIAIGCDHTAIDLKNTIIQHLTNLGHIVTDVGPFETTRTHYPLYAIEVSKKILMNEVDEGVLICGTGVGMSIAANKHNGIRAVVCSEPYSARLSKMHNDSNIVCFGARVVGDETAKDIVDAFFGVKYEGGRHQTRVDQIKQIEHDNNKY